MTADPRGLALGVDIGGTKILGCVVNQDHVVIAEQRRMTPNDGGSGGLERIVEDVGGMIVGLHRELDLEVGSMPLGIGVPGMVDAFGTLVYAPNLQVATGSAIKEIIQQGLDGVPIEIANDADCAALAEYHAGTGQGHEEMVMITLGTGIGGGIIHQGHLFGRSNGFAGEFGHMVLERDGPSCPCGANGCWERYVSGTALERLADEARIANTIHGPEGNSALTGAEVTELARQGNAEAKAVTDEMGYWLARGIAMLVYILDPSCVVIGGGLADAIDLLLPQVDAVLPGLLEGGSRHPEVLVCAARFGESGGAVGSSLLARGIR